MTKYIQFIGLSFCLTACVSEKDGDEENGEPVEGETQGDCIDGEDNDGDGLLDCDDDGCSDVSACSYTGGYQMNRCDDALASTGYAVGDITYDFEMMDQHGDTVTLSDFCGSVVLLEASAFW